MALKQVSPTDEFIKGLWRDNPVFIQVLAPARIAQLGQPIADFGIVVGWLIPRIGSVSGNGRCTQCLLKEFEVHGRHADTGNFFRKKP